MDRWYYGARYAKNCSPEDLWKSYFTSSKWVTFARLFWGEPDIIEIRRKFNSVDRCREWEHMVLRRLGAVKSEKWLNRTDNRAIHPEDCARGGCEWTVVISFGFYGIVYFLFFKLRGKKIVEIKEEPKLKGVFAVTLFLGWLALLGATVWGMQ